MKFTIDDGRNAESGEVLALYEDAGWTAYTAAPEKLMRAIGASQSVLIARDESGELCGMLRMVGDGETIAYIQDILVKDSARRSGVGRALVMKCRGLYPNIRQWVLLADNVPETRSFYTSCGFKSAGDYGCVAYVQFEEAAASDDKKG
ncbi:MAG: GNAT family N-acetyltransferase [Eubacteriales bacterium]|nr:GNAT family N-acetyltransferase [Eubacteriales bacterium]MDD3880942.1 GNAT family N-acetyltransferase [Eubacteriales bacterium]MDD4511988.1 GNAT family N-acetyltransferase [Eubacteriales bacterium]